MAFFYLLPLNEQKVIYFERLLEYRVLHKEAWVVTLLGTLLPLLGVLDHKKVRGQIPMLSIVLFNYFATKTLEVIIRSLNLLNKNMK